MERVWAVVGCVCVCVCGGGGVPAGGTTADHHREVRQSPVHSLEHTVATASERGCFRTVHTMGCGCTPTTRLDGCYVALCTPGRLVPCCLTRHLQSSTHSLLSFATSSHSPCLRCLPLSTAVFARRSTSYAHAASFPTPPTCRPHHDVPNRPNLCCCCTARCGNGCQTQATRM
jgi:hypothetical protein